MDIHILADILVSFCLTYFAIPPIVRISNEKSLFDLPNERKLNKFAIPTLGGVAIFIGISISSILFLPDADMPGLRYMSASVIMMFFVGLKDDIMIISAVKKLIIQIAAALIMVYWGGFRIIHTYGIFSIDQFPDWISYPFSVLLILFIINSINLIDGIDGLAAGIILLTASILGFWFCLSGIERYAIVCFAVCGSLLAFIRFNLWGAEYKIFMGDTGSLILGVITASIMIKFSEWNYTNHGIFYLSQAPLIGLTLLIVPVTDTIRVFAIRLYHKRSPFSPDMNHFHHLLIRSGFSHIQASSFLITYTLFFFLLGMTMQQYTNITTGFAVILTMSFSFIGLIYMRSKKAEKMEITIAENSDVKTIRLNPWQRIHITPEKKVVFEKH